MEQIILKLPGVNDRGLMEAFQMLRTNIQFCGQDIRVILVTGVEEQAGKTTVCLHLARSLAEQGRKVLVLDGDMRGSLLAERNTALKDPAGLSEVLSGTKPVHECLYAAQNMNMHLLFAGKYPPNPVELLGSQQFSALVTLARKAYDYVIVDSPSLGRVVDAAVMAQVCDGAVLVLGNETRAGKARTVVDQLRRSGCRILGAVRSNVKKSGPVPLIFRKKDEQRRIRYQRR